MLSTILFCLVSAMVAGGSGYFLSFRFNRTNYAATDTSGDFGAPRGALIFTFSGMLIGIAFCSLAGTLHIFPPQSLGFAMMAAMFTGIIAGVVGMFQGQNSRNKN